jgi:hypothetical protein
MHGDSPGPADSHPSGVQLQGFRHFGVVAAVVGGQPRRNVELMVATGAARAISGSCVRVSATSLANAVPSPDRDALELLPRACILGSRRSLSDNASVRAATPQQHS